MKEKQIGPVYISLIIPAFNEEGRIGNSMERILNFLHNQNYSSEIIVVDDGSQDGTVEVARKVCQDNNGLRILSNGKNHGKGSAVRSGMLNARGEYLFFTDADLSVPIETLSEFLYYLTRDYDIVIGSRQKDGAVIEVHQPLYREFMGRIYTGLSNWILGLDVSDFTCGFKGFRKEAARELFSLQRLPKWSFDAEILYMAQIKGYKILEAPVRWRNDDASKVRLQKDVYTSFLELVQIRLNHRSERKISY